MVASPHLLVLDLKILIWVFLPIAIVMFMIGVLRHYGTLYLQVQPTTTREQAQKANMIRRSARLRQHAHLLPPSAWNMRKKFFISKALVRPAAAAPAASSSSKENKDQQPQQPELPQQDPMAMMNMMKQQMLMIVPSMASMAWVSYFFSGFVVGKLPFSLTQRFKVMLQRGVALKTLDSSYVSSLSWYFLNMLGSQGLIALVLGGQSEASDTKMMQMQMQGQLMPGAPQAPDMNAMLDAERMEMEIASAPYRIPEAEYRILGLKAPSESVAAQQQQQRR